MVFITKKQKLAMRQRRRRKEKVLKKATNEGEEVESSKSGIKRKRHDNDNIDEPTSTEQEQQYDENWTIIKDETSNSVKTVTLTVPPELSTKDAKKFRKDTRRQIRSQITGIEEDQIVFVSIHDNDDNDDDEDDDNKSKKKKQKKTFIRINDILAAQKADSEKDKEKQQRQKAQDKIPHSERLHYMALDCEMVGVGATGESSALARVSIVDWDGEILLDKFVKVPQRVTDFRTWVSGVRASDIKQDGDAMDLQECRTLVGNMIKDKILVGHALKNDFKALMLDHDRKRIRDTAKYAPYMRPHGKNGGKLRPRKLRDLAKERLNLTIQADEDAHSSVDDAIAAMELYKLERTRWEKEIVLKHSKSNRA